MTGVKFGKINIRWAHGFTPSIGLVFVPFETTSSFVFEKKMQLKKNEKPESKNNAKKWNCKSLKSTSDLTRGLKRLQPSFVKSPRKLNPNKIKRLTCLGLHF